MTKKSPTIVFFGNERLATGVTTTAPVLRSLIGGGYHVAAVVVNFHTPHSRSAKKAQLEVVQVANQHNIPVMIPQKLTEAAQQLKSYGASAGVLLAYGKIIPQSIIDLFPRGIINLHPSLLPKHRGSIPIESVLLNGEQSTGMSIMKLVSAMDAGPVLAQSTLSVRGNESKQELYERLIERGISLLTTHLPSILDGSCLETEQDHDQATYDERLSKQSGCIDWRKSAIQIEREVRAYIDWPKSTTKLAGTDVVITDAVLDTESNTQQNQKPGSIDVRLGRLSIACGDGNLLVVNKLKPSGKQEMTAAGFINGYILNKR